MKSSSYSFLVFRHLDNLQFQFLLKIDCRIYESESQRQGEILNEENVVNQAFNSNNAKSLFKILKIKNKWKFLDN